MKKPTLSMNAMIAGALPLLALPAAWLIFVRWSGGDDESGVRDELLHSWLFYPSALVVVLACLHSGRVVARAIDDSRVPGPLALLPLLIPSLLAFGLTDHDLAQAMKATTHCYVPWTNVVVFTASTALAYRTLALLVAACVCLALVIGLVPTLRSSERLARGGFLLAIAVVGASFFVAASAADTARCALATVAVPGATDLTEVLLRAASKWREATQAANTLLLSAVLCAAGAAMRVTHRGEALRAIGSLVVICFVAFGVRAGGLMEERLVERRTRPVFAKPELRTIDLPRVLVTGKWLYEQHSE